jgi:organic radical activating enzyme
VKRQVKAESSKLKGNEIGNLNGFRPSLSALSFQLSCLSLTGGEPLWYHHRLRSIYSFVSIHKRHILAQSGVFAHLKSSKLANDDCGFKFAQLCSEPKSAIYGQTLVCR